MLPKYHDNDALDDLLRHDLNLPADHEVGGLSVQHMANIATRAAATATGYTAVAHLLDLLAGLPAPREDGEGFWAELWMISGSDYLNCSNFGPHVAFALRGDGAGLADHLLSGLDELDVPRRTEVAKLIGTSLADVTGLGSSRKQAQQFGELWLRDLELTCWRVLYVARGPEAAGPEERRAFRDAWQKA